MIIKFSGGLLFLFLSAVCFFVEAQDTDAGLSRPAAPKKKLGAADPIKRRKQKSNTDNSTDKTTVKKSSVSSRTEKNSSGNIEVTVDQAGSRVEIIRVENGVERVAGSPVIADSGEIISFNPVKFGDYILRARKNGFYEEERKITVKSGKVVAVNINLRPSAGFLTVSSRLADAEIEIEGVGNFTGKIDDLILAPQVYRVYITKEGFEPLVETADIRLGQTTIISADLQPITSEKLLRNAESDFQANRYRETLASCRLMLERNPDDAPANLLMGYGYFYTDRPRESRFYLARALALRSEVELPVKIYQKEKSYESLTDGTLKITRAVVSFSSAKKPELNFNLPVSSIGKLDINRDAGNSGNLSSPDFIEIKASVGSGKKVEKKSFRLFARQVFARVVASSRAEIADCADCADDSCPCRKEIRAVYDLLLNWKSGSFPRRTADAFAVASPSANFVRYENEFFSANIPDNWQTIEQSNNSVWLAPNSGFSRRAQNSTQYFYAVNVGKRAIKTNDLFAESAVYYRELLSANAYLDQQNAPRKLFISGRSALVSNFVGFNVESGMEESVQVYTVFAIDGTLFYVVTVTPFGVREKYKPVFQLVSDSLVMK